MDKRSTQEKQQEAIEGFLREILGPLTRDKPKHLDDLIALLRSRGVGKSKSLCIFVKLCPQLPSIHNLPFYSFLVVSLQLLLVFCSPASKNCCFPLFAH